MLMYTRSIKVDIAIGNLASQGLLLPHGATDPGLRG
jgi:hypothetical protein